MELVILYRVEMAFQKYVEAEEKKEKPREWWTHINKGITVMRVGDKCAVSQVCTFLRWE